MSTKRILLIGNDRTEGDTHEYYESYVSFFRDSVAHHEDVIDIAWTLLQDLYIEVGDGELKITDTKTSRILSEYDVLVIRGMGFREQFDVLKAVSAYAHAHSVTVINDYRAFRDSSKLAQAVQFHEVGLPVAKTVYVNRAVLQEAHSLTISFPCIMKAVFGAHGNDNYVVHSLEDVRRIVAESPARFVLQRFVPNDGDYRILIVGDNVRCIERTAVEGSHLNNTSQGGAARMVEERELPQDMIRDARVIAKHLDMTVAGVDALIDTQSGDYYFLEVNSQPQLMTGAYVDEKKRLVGEYLADLLMAPSQKAVDS